ncbi:MAG: XRE family transcriptional regulator [Mesorhizobium sp.]
MNSLIGERLFVLREEKDVSQSAVATMLGLKDRQSVQAIESGERAVKADELVKLARGFNVPLDFFTDPFRLSQKVDFSWRKSGDIGSAEISAFQDKAKGWIGAYRALAEEEGQLPVLLKRIGIGERSSFEDARAAAERLVRDHFPADEVPASALARVIEDDLGTLVIMADADIGISGAACRTLDMNVTIVNRTEPAERRNFDLAHELFHVLTWDELPPAYLDGEEPGRKQKRTEQLANNFAGALLAPAHLLEKHRSGEFGTADWLNRTADVFGMSSAALKFRLLNLGWISQAQADSVPDAVLRNNGRSARKPDAPLAFGRKFLAAFASGIGEGRISVRKAAGILGVTVDGLRSLLEAHGFENAFDL